MEESSTYQAILAEGREEGRGEGVAVARKMLRVAGEREFGSSDTAIIDALDAITDLAQLEALCQRLRTASSWQELLAAPAPRRRRRRPAP